VQDTPIDKLLDKTHSIYKLVVLAARRAIELADGAQKLVDTPPDTKPSGIAIEEILTGKVEYKIKEGK
jgi:DNA-directed RNA polymerase omega subunit